MTTDDLIDVAMSRVSDRELAERLDSRHKAHHRREHLMSAKAANAQRYVEMSQPSEEEELWTRR